MLSDTDAACVDIYWGCVQQKEGNNRCAEACYWRRAQHNTTQHNTHTHTHTQRHKNFTTYLMFSAPNDNNTLLWLHGPTLNHLLKTVALQSHKYWQQKQSPTVSVYPLRYAIWTVEMVLNKWNFRFRHVYCGHCTILSTLYNGYSAIPSTVNVYCVLLPIYNWYCAILSTEYLIDAAQYFPQNIQWMLLNTVHRTLFLRLQNKKTVAPDWHNTLRKPSIL